MTRLVVKIFSPTFLPLVALSLALSVAACDGGAAGSRTTADETPAGAAVADGAAAGAAEETVDEDIGAALAAADAADGKIDRVVSRCMTCSLHMDGEEKYSADAYGYTMHLCSENCLFRFERNPARAIRALPTGGS